MMAWFTWQELTSGVIFTREDSTETIQNSDISYWFILSVSD
jgi:hypothetical protein